MNEVTRKSLLRNAFWLGGLALLVGALIGGTVARLSRGKANVESLRYANERKRTELLDVVESGNYAADLEVAELELEDLRRMTQRESLRIAELSAAARASGVSIVSLQNSAPEVAGDERSVRCSHNVRSVGSYRQLAEFLGELQSARGLAAIEELEIDHGTNLEPGVLTATMDVVWFAPGSVSAFEAREAVE